MKKPTKEEKLMEYRAAIKRVIEKLEEILKELKMLKILIILLSVFLVSCAGAQTAKVTETADGLKYEQAEPGIFEAEKTKEGWKIKSDTKKEPLKLIDFSGMKPKIGAD